ncbi:MAG TPA: hypothetical protein VGG61_16745 [Gemmataceae bacterium]
MLARFLTVCLTSAALLAVSFVLAGAKPPDLPMKVEVDCRDSAPQSVPITVATPAAATTAVGPIPLAVPATPCATCPACAATNKMVTKVYTVADLVIPIEKGKDGKTTEDQLIKLITTTVSPESWDAKGGAGTLAYHPLTLSLAVNQPPHVQEQIADLLATLRHAQDTQVAVEVRFVCVSEEFWVKWQPSDKESASTCSAAKKCGSAKVESSGVHFLSDEQFRQFIDAAQEDLRTNVMQAPKVTMLNGQGANVDICDQQFFTTGVSVFVKNGAPIFRTKNEPIDLGTKMSLLPVVSADKRFVRVNVNATLTSQDSDDVPPIPVKLPVQVKDENGCSKPVEFTQFLQAPSVTTLTVDKTLTLPDGGSALLNMGKRAHEGKQCFGPPVLSKIPYIDRLFKKVGTDRETERVLMVVTPRIIVEEAEETCVAKCGQPKACGKAMPPVDAEEQEEPPSTAKKCEGCCEKCPQCCQAKAVEIVEKYHKACSEGHADEATKLAVQALAIDPTCFSKPRTAPAGKSR